LTIGDAACAHPRFVEEADKAQSLYEKARKAALDGRFRAPENLSGALKSHGVAGIFIDPERVVPSTPEDGARQGARTGTALYRTRLADGVFATVAKSLAEGVGVSSTARILDVDKKTVLLVLSKASEHIAEVNEACLRGLAVSECQLDEMWSFIGKKEKNLDAVEKMKSNLGDAWIWVAFDAVNKVFLAAHVGKRTMPCAVETIEEVRRVTSGMPLLFSSDQLAHYPNALLRVYGERKRVCGSARGARLVPPDDLLYVQVVKEYKDNRVVKIDRKIVFGDPERVEKVLGNSPVSRKINTAYVERSNGSIRHLNARCNRKTLRFSKLKENHVRQLRLSLAYYHFCRPHRTLTGRFGSPTTPFMAGGLTDHVWSMEELLTCKVKIQCV
jgi:IS1 family transposase